MSPLCTLGRVQAWCVRSEKTGLLQRWCSGHERWEHPDVFGGFWHACQNRLSPSRRAEAEAIAERIARARADGTLDGAPPAAAAPVPRITAEPAAMPAAAAVHAVDETVEEWRPEWGRQTAVVNGYTACKQVKEYLGMEGTIDFVEIIRGSRAGSGDDDIAAAVTALYQRLAQTTQPAVSAM